VYQPWKKDSGLSHLKICWFKFSASWWRSCRHLIYYTDQCTKNKV